MFRKSATSQESALKFEYFPLKRSASFFNVLDEKNEIVGTYRPEEKILGKGAFGVVSKFKFTPADGAKQYDLPEYVAVKKSMLHDFNFRIIRNHWSLEEYYSNPNISGDWSCRDSLDIVLEKEKNPATLCFMAQWNFEGYKSEVVGWIAYLRGDIIEYAAQGIKIPRESNLDKELEKIGENDSLDSVSQALITQYPEIKDIGTDCAFQVSGKDVTTHAALAKFLSEQYETPAVLFLWDEDGWVIYRHKNLGRKIEKDSALEQELNKDPSELDLSKLQKLFFISKLFSDEELSQQLVKSDTKARQACFAEAYQDYFREFEAWPHIAKLPGLFFAIREVENKTEEKYETVVFDQSSKGISDAVQSDFKKCRLVLPFIEGSDLDTFLSKHVSDKNKVELFLKVLLLVAEDIKRIHTVEGYAHRDIAGRNILVSMQNNDETSINVRLIDAGLAEKNGRFSRDSYYFIIDIVKLFWPTFLGYHLEKEENPAIKARFLEVCSNKDAVPPSMDAIIDALQSKLSEYQQAKNNNVKQPFVFHVVPQVSVTPTVSEEKQSLIKKEEGVDGKKTPVVDALKRFGISAAKPAVVQVPARGVKRPRNRPSCAVL